MYLKFKHCLFAICLISLGLGCKSDKKLNTEKDTYDWLIGSWQPDNDPTRIETWNKISSMSYTGIGLKYVGTDTMQAFEYLRLFKLDDKWQYSAQVEGQNSDQAILFIQSEKNESSVLDVTNEHHDFPKSINYNKISNNKMEVILNKGLPDQLLLNYIQIEN